MGTWYKIANPTKRQYLRPIDFGASGKNTWFLSEHLGVAVTLLVGGPYSPYGHPLVSAWHGDAIFFAEDHAPPDLFGIPTRTPEHPERNLYALCSQEYENLALPALAMVLTWREDAAEQLARFALANPYEGPHLLANLADLTSSAWGSHVDTERLELALDTEAGADWRDRCRKLRAEYPRT